MARNKQALKPNTFISQLPTFIKEKEATSEDATQEEKQLATMSRTAGWRVFKEYVEQVKGEMDSINDRAIENGANFEIIGQNALIISQTKRVIDRILNKVADAREASEKQK